MDDRPVSDRAIISLIAGLVALMFTWFHRGGPLTVVSVPAGLAAIAAGVAALRSGAAGRGLATTGVVLGTIALASWLLIKGVALVF